MDVLTDVTVVSNGLDDSIREVFGVRRGKSESDVGVTCSGSHQKIREPGARVVSEFVHFLETF